MKQNRKKNLDFSFINENSMLEFQTELVRIHKECDSWVEAITSYCEDHSIGVDEVVHLLSDSIKSKLYDEAVANRRIKPEYPSLPL